MANEHRWPPDRILPSLPPTVTASLHFLKGASHTYAYGIDGTNIVGSFSDGSDVHGLSYDGSTYTTLDVPGASSTYAYDIDGTNIVGFFYDGSGNSHGFLAVIPEPATLSLLAVGMLMACRRRR